MVTSQCFIPTLGCKISNCNYQIDYLFTSCTFQDDEFHEILRSAEKIEFLYGHWFDEILVNDDLTKAFDRLVNIAKKVETEPLWVPANWVQ